MRVRADTELCIQAGNCVMVAPDVFDQDDDGIVVVLTEDVDDSARERAREAVTLCPSQALSLVED